MIETCREMEPLCVKQVSQILDGISVESSTLSLTDTHQVMREGTHRDRAGRGQGTQSLLASLLKHKLTKLNLMLQG